MPKTTTEIRKRCEPPSVSLRVLRDAHGISVSSLVERLADQGVKVTDDHIRNVELGWKNPSPELLAAWARVFQIARIDITTEQDRARMALGESA